MTIELKMTLVYVILGAVVGVLSSYVYNNIIVLLMALTILIATIQVLQRVLKLEKKEGSEQYTPKWWLANGAYPYLIFWLFVWIIFYNL